MRVWCLRTTFRLQQVIADRMTCVLLRLHNFPFSVQESSHLCWNSVGMVSISKPANGKLSLLLLNYVTFMRVCSLSYFRVDFFIPDSDHIGGFSIVSPPSLLQKHSEIKLAVKSSKWPPALWIHEQCKVGDSINIRIGDGSSLHRELV